VFEKSSSSPRRVKGSCTSVHDGVVIKRIKLDVPQQVSYDCEQHFNVKWFLASVTTDLRNERGDGSHAVGKGHCPDQRHDDEEDAFLRLPMHSSNLNISRARRLRFKVFHNPAAAASYR
jgi:hypothetical protein